MLYQVATGLLSSDEVAAPIRSILRRQKNVTVLMAEVVGVDPHARVVFTRDGTVAYDYLEVSSGGYRSSRSDAGFGFFHSPKRKRLMPLWVRQILRSPDIGSGMNPTANEGARPPTSACSRARRPPRASSR